MATHNELAKTKLLEVIRATYANGRGYVHFQPHFEAEIEDVVDEIIEAVIERLADDLVRRPSALQQSLQAGM